MSICRPVFTDMLWRMFLELGTNNILPFSWRVLIDLSKPPINQSVLNILHIIFDTVFICRMYILLLNCQTYCKCNRIFVSSNHTYKMRFHEKCIQDRQYIANRRYVTRLDAIKPGCSFLLSRQQLKYGSCTVALHSVSYWYYTLPKCINGLSETNIIRGWYRCLRIMLSNYVCDVNQTRM